ncbi:hypothetical protein HDU79_003969 [Rhizoclosmatium sp. JEL0117]|nr:hypothetical protein HDU79_003969 [Rhizoclosmatium sp. JEL0117]
MKSTIVLAALTSTTFAQTTFSSPSAQLTSILQDLPNCALICLTTQLGRFDISLLSSKLCANTPAFISTFSECTRVKCTSSLEQKLVEPFVGFGTVYCDAVKKGADQVGVTATKAGGGSVAATITGAANATETGDVDNGDSQAATTDVATQTVAVDGKAAIQSTSTTSSASTVIWTLGFTSILLFFL